MTGTEWYKEILVQSLVFFFFGGVFLAWSKNSRHLVTPSLVSPRNDVWAMTAEIPYWWHVTAQSWIVLLIGWSKFLSRNNQSEAATQIWVVTTHLAGKQVAASRNVDCFIRLMFSLLINLPIMVSTSCKPLLSWKILNAYLIVMFKAHADHVQ